MQLINLSKWVTLIFAHCQLHATKLPTNNKKKVKHNYVAFCVYSGNVELNFVSKTAFKALFSNFKFAVVF